jgi:multiple sugar transport system permease protein
MSAAAEAMTRGSGKGIRRFSRIAQALLVNGLLIFLAMIVLSPFVWMILTSIKDPAEIFSRPFALDADAFEARKNYALAFTKAPMVQFMLNGVIVVAGVLTVQLATSLMAAYALAKLEFRGRTLLMSLVLFGLCIPIHVPALPLYLGLAKLDLLNSYFALMFPWFFSAFAIFLFRQHFKSFPDEIVNAARLDGFSEFEILLRLVIPSAAPAIAAFSVFSVTAHWNDLYWPLIVVSSVDRMTPPVGLLFFRDAETGTSYGVLMAAAAIITLPLVIVFLTAQRQFVQGVTMTGMK